MPDAIFVEGGVLIPGDAIEMKFVRASGPGGQNVNKVSSKALLRVDLDRIRGMDAAGHQRLLRIVARRLDSEGRLMASSQRSRDQFRNLEDARRKIHDWIAQAMRPPKQRASVRLNKTLRERRLEEKRQRSVRKAGRRRVDSAGDEIF